MTHNHKLLMTLAALMALSFQLLVPALAHAGGVGIAPVEIEIKEALRGGEYRRTIMFMNQEDGDITFQISLEGEVATWASMHPLEEPAVSIDAIEVPAHNDARLLLRILVPPDAPNGPHNGTVRFQSVPSADKSKESGMGVSIGVASNLKIDVTGTQRLSGVVLDMSTDDVEIDQPPLRLHTMFKNDGNVKANPVINLQVKTPAGTTVGEASFNNTVVEADHIAQIQSEWDISGKPVGKYVAEATVVLGDIQIDKRDLNFEIFPRGTLTRSGALDTLKLEGQPQVGAVAKVTGTFRNTGKIDTRAILTGEVYRDSALVKVIESRERLVPLGELAVIDMFFDVTLTGSYIVRAKVGYEGKETEARELTFKVDAGNELLSSTALSLIGGALAAIGVVSATGIFALRKRRRSKSLRSNT